MNCSALFRANTSNDPLLISDLPRYFVRVLWIARPPYVRWTLIGLLVLVSLWLELRPSATVTHPFLTRDLIGGESVENALEWREIAQGVLEPVPGTGFADRRLTAGQPLLHGDTTDVAMVVPPGWWLVDVVVPAEATAGTHVQLVVLPSPGHRPIPPIGGLVTGIRPADYESDGLIGSVAFPPDRAATAAVAIAEKRVSVLVQAYNEPAAD